MKTTIVILISACLLVGVSSWAQTSAPVSPGTTEGSAPSTPPANKPEVGTAPANPPAPAPGQPGSATTPGAPSGPGASAQDRPASPQGQPVPRSQDQPVTPLPGTPGRPADQVVGETRVFGLTPMTALILGVVFVGIVIALVAMSARGDREVIVDRRVERDVEVYDRDRDRPRKIS